MRHLSPYKQRPAGSHQIHPLARPCCVTPSVFAPPRWNGPPCPSVTGCGGNQMWGHSLETVCICGKKKKKKDISLKSHIKMPLEAGFCIYKFTWAKCLQRDKMNAAIWISLSEKSDTNLDVPLHAPSFISEKQNKNILTCTELLSSRDITSLSTCFVNQHCCHRRPWHFFPLLIRLSGVMDFICLPSCVRNFCIISFFLTMELYAI